MEDNKWYGILVYLECEKQILTDVSKELIGEAYRLSMQYKQPIYAIAIGKNIVKIKEQLCYFPLKTVILLETEEEFKADLYEHSMNEWIHKIKPSIVLIGGTRQGRALAPRLAVEFKTGLTADCTKLEMTEKGELVQVRPAFGGNIMASIRTERTRPQLATVRPNVMEELSEKFSFPIDFIYGKIYLYDSKIKIVNKENLQEEDGINNYNLLVVAGRGIKKKEDLEMLRELAEVMGGRLASSRALVEKGWLSPSSQIGLSGQTVKPEYMITCGVSGSVQFLSGIKQTKNVIAINNDPDASILKIAHYPICGDLYEIIPLLMKMVKKHGRIKI